MRTIIRNVLPYSFLFLLGAIVIFFQFDRIPRFTTFDEIEFAKLALQLDGKAYTPYSAYATGHATLYFYILLFFLKLGEISTFFLRLPAALFGLANILLIYAVLREVKSETKHNRFWYIAALCAAITFATLRWHFTFARFAFEGTFLLFLELLSLLFFFRWKRKKGLFSLAASFLFAGLAYNSYQPGRIFILVIGMGLVVELLKVTRTTTQHRKRVVMSYVRTVLIACIPFIIAILPLTFYLSRNTDIRMYQQFYPANTEMRLEEKFEFLGRNITSAFTMFTIKGDVNGRHNYPHKPAINPIILALFVAGLIIGFSKKTRRADSLVFAVYLFLALLPALLTYPWENPNMLRNITVLPALIYFLAVAVEQMLEVAQHKQIFLWGVAIVAALIVGSALYDLRTYFVFQPSVFDEAFEAHQPLSYYTQFLHEKK